MSEDDRMSKIETIAANLATIRKHALHLKMKGDTSGQETYEVILIGHKQYPRHLSSDTVFMCERGAVSDSRILVCL